MLPETDSDGNDIIGMVTGAFQDTSPPKLAYTMEVDLTNATKLKTIGNQAFYRNTGITYVTMSDSVTSLGSSTFNGCTNLKGIVLSNNITEFGSSAFQNTTSLEYIRVNGKNDAKNFQLPDALKTIGTSAFYSAFNPLVSVEVVIPELVTSIGVQAFYNNKAVTYVTMSDSVTSLGKNALYGCTNLKGVVLSKKIDSIGEGAFQNTTSLEYIRVNGNGDDKNFELPEALKTIGKGAFRNAFTSSVSADVVIPELVTSIGDQAFYDNKALTYVTMSDFVTSLGAGAFYGCKKLKGVVLSNKITSIGSTTFQNTTSLEYIRVNGNGDDKNFELPDGLKTIGTSAFHSAFNPSVSVDVVIPELVTSIGTQAFYRNMAVTYVTMSDSVTSLELNAFNGCTNLKGIVLSKNITSIGDSALRDTTSLEYIRVNGKSNTKNFELPDGLKTIGASAFYSAFNPSVSADVVIPKSVNSIGNQAFYSSLAIKIIELEDGIDYTKFKGTQLTYDGFSSAGSGQGTGKRIILMQNYDTYKLYYAIAGAPLRQGLSFLIDLEFRDEQDNLIKTEKKLYGQMVGFVKSEITESWGLDLDYELPAVPENIEPAEEGYQWVWMLGDEKITTFSNMPNTIVSDAGVVKSILRKVPIDPIISPLVNGKIGAIETWSSLSMCQYNAEVGQVGSIGIDLNHPLLAPSSSTGDGIRFTYTWTDIQDHKKGSRNTDGSLLTNGVFTNEISINGVRDSRVSPDYYLVEVKGYYDHADLGWIQFFKTGTNIIASSSNAYSKYIPAITFVTGDNYSNGRVKFDLNGGEYNGSTNSITWDKAVVNSVLGKIADQYGYTIPEPKQVGFELTGWTLNDEEKLIPNDSMYGQYVPFTIPNPLFTAQWVPAELTLTFDATTNGGEGVFNPITNTYGTFHNIDENPTPEDNHDFIGWFTKEKGGLKITNFNQLIEDTTLYAQYIDSGKLQLVFEQGDYGEVNGETSPLVKVVDKGDTIGAAPDINVNKGYKFIGWQLFEDGVEKGIIDNSKIGAYSVNNHTTFIAQYTRSDKATVIFDYNGGKAISGTATSYTQTGYEGDKYNIPLYKTSFDKEGHTFNGWYEKKATGSPVTLNGEFGSAGSSITYFAQWTVNKITLTFDAETNGGSNPPASLTDDYGTTIDLSLHNPTPPTDHLFMGWFTEAKNGTKITNFNELKEDAILFAQYTPSEKRTVAFERGDHGSLDPDFSDDITLGEPVGDIIPNVIPDLGYEFTGWLAIENGEEIGIFNNEHAKKYIVNNHVTFTAQYARTDKATVIFDYNGGNSDVDDSTYYIQNGYEGDHVTIPEVNTLHRTGYRFVGWSKDVDGISGINSPDPEFASAGSVTTYYAQWRVNTYIVMFNEYDGSTIKIITDTEHGSELGRSNVPDAENRTGFVFVGWESSETNGIYPDAKTAGKYVVTSQVIFTARYEDIAEAVVIFDYNGGISNVGETSTYISGKPGEAYPVPDTSDISKLGYTIDETTPWNNTSANEAELEKFAEAGSVTIYSANWNIDTHSVIFESGENGTIETLAPETVEYGSNVTTVPNVTPNTGYEFIGWLSSTGGVYSDAEAIKEYIVTRNVTFTATFAEKTKATAIFDANGGLIDSENSVTLTGLEGTTYTKPNDPIKTGFTFKNWETKLGSAELETFGEAGSVTIYIAKWEATKYTVEFKVEANGTTADKILYENEIPHGTFMSEVPSITANTGYEFTGWNVDGSVLTPAGVKLYPITQDIIFIAQYAETTKATAIFDANGGLIGSDDSVTLTGLEGTTYTKPNDPIKTGFTFKNWETKLGSAELETFGEAGSVTIYIAKWEATKYTVEFKVEANGTTADKVLYENEIPHGTFMSEVPSITANTGYEFTGWIVDDITLTPAGVKLYPITQDTIFTAQYSNSDNAIVVFEYNGGNADQASSKTVSGQPGTTGLVPTPIRDGYILAGWDKNPTTADDVSSGQAFTFGGAKTTTTYTAKWTVNTYTVEFAEYDGTIITTITDIDHGSELGESNVPDAANRTGFVFVGWESSETNGIYPDANTAGKYAVTSNVTFTAKYEDSAEAVVIFDYNGGANQAGETSTYISGKPGETYPVPDTSDISKLGYTIDETTPWNKTSENEAELEKFAEAGSVTIYSANWNIDTHSVIFESGENGTIETLALENEIVNYGNSVTRVPNAIPNTGYKFIGWKSSTGGIYSDADAVKQYVVTSNVTFIATFAEKTKATAIFDANGGLIGSDDSVILTGLEGTTYTKPNDPTKTGFTFKEWETKSGSAKLETFGEAGSVAIYVAKWEATKYTVEFKVDANGTTVDKVLYENEIPHGTFMSEVPSITANTGYEFIGWSVDGSVLTPAGVKLYPITQDTIFTAQYSNSDNAIVVFEYNGGNLEQESSKTVSGQPGTTGLVPTPIRDGYILAGWDKNPTTAEDVSSGQVFTFGGAKTTTTYTAKWDAIDNIVTFVTRNATLSHNEAVVKTNDKIETSNIPSVKEESGYTFQNRWICSLGGTYTTEQLAEYIVTKDVQFTADVVPNEGSLTDRTLTFDANGGTNAPQALTMSKDTIINLSGFTVDPPANYYFAGWFDSKVGGKELTVITMSNDTTVYAQFEAIPEVGVYEVAFIQGDHGSFTIPNDPLAVQSIKASETVTNIPRITADTDYRFIGWQIDGTGDIFTEAAIKNISVKKDFNYVAAYAKTGPPSEVQFTLTFDEGLGSNPPSPVTLAKDSVLNLLGYTATAPIGQEFIGWINQKGDIVTSIVFDKDTTLTAKYAMIATYTVTFDQGDYGILVNNPVIEIVQNGKTVSNVPVPMEDTDYTFYGWAMDGDSTIYTDIAILAMNISENKTFTACYSSDLVTPPDQYITLDFDTTSNGGSGNIPQIKMLKGAVIDLSNYIATPKNGDVFVGWFDAQTGGNQIIKYTLESNSIVYAQYEKQPELNEYIVAFDIGANGSQNDVTDLTQAVLENETAVAPSVNGNPGYKFIGWQVDGVGSIYTNETINVMPVNQNTNYVAYYQDNTVVITNYTLSFDPLNGSNAPEDIVLPSGTVINVNGFTVTAPQNYVFIGWAMKDGTIVTSVKMDSDVTLFAKYSVIDPSGPFTVTFETNDSGTMTPSTYSETVIGGESVKSVPTIVAKTRYTFLGWSMNGGTSYYSSEDVAKMSISSDITFTAKYHYSGGGSGNGSTGGGTTNYTLSFEENGGSEISSVSRSTGTVVDLSKFVPTKDGYKFLGWYTNAELTESVSSVKLTHDIVVYAKWEVDTETPLVTLNDLNTEDHINYFVGYEDGSFRAGNSITRSEVAMIFYRLLKDQNKGGIKTFSDLEDGMWYTTAIEKLAGLGILKGYENGEFHPDAFIQRAEFTAIAARFTEITESDLTFSDVARDHWAHEYIATAASHGWIDGYPGGVFLPDNEITRAEVATVINRMLMRYPDKEYIDSESVKTFTDLDSSYWAYYDIMESANAHDYTKDDSGQESWTNLK